MNIEVTSVSKKMYQIRQLEKSRIARTLRGAILFLAVSVMGLALATQAQAQSAGEYQVKAAFIFNFAKFVDWPSDALGDGTLRVGVVGDNPFGWNLDRLNGSTVNGRRLRIKRLRSGDNLRDCHILFISNSEERNLRGIIESIRGAAVLTIGEMSQFNRSGGMIRFVIQDDKVRFEINNGAAGQARLRISSKLLALSKGGN